MKIKAFVMLLQLVSGHGYWVGADTMDQCDRILRAERAKQTRAGLIVASSGCFPRALIEHAGRK